MYSRFTTRPLFVVAENVWLDLLCCRIPKFQLALIADEEVLQVETVAIR